MKIVLVEYNAGHHGSVFTHGGAILEPIGIEYVGALAKSIGHEVKIIQQNEFSNDVLFELIFRENPDIVGFSAIAYNFGYAREVAKRLKVHSSKIVTVFGGYHATSVPQIVEDESIDYVVIGEGEQTFVELIQMIKSNGDPNAVKGIAHFDKTVRITPPRYRIKELDSLPFPLRESQIIKNCRYDGLYLPPLSKQIGVAQILYSRGCSYNCTYCNSSAMWGRKVTWRTPASVVAEIKYLQENFDTNLIFFTDLTFNLKKAKIYKLCEEIKRQKVEVNWFCGCRTRNIDKEIIENMKSAGCTKIHYGIESLNDSTLYKLNRKNGIETMKEVVNLTSFSGLLVRGYTMIGYPWESQESIKTMLNQLKDFAIDDLRISFFTPFPGTPLYEKFKREGLLLTEDYSKYTTDEPVVKTKDLTPGNLVELRRDMFRKFYTSKEYEQRRKIKSVKFPYLKQAYDEFNEFLIQKGILE